MSARTGIFLLVAAIAVAGGALLLLRRQDAGAEEIRPSSRESRRGDENPDPGSAAGEPRIVERTGIVSVPVASKNKAASEPGTAATTKPEEAPAVEAGPPAAREESGAEITFLLKDEHGEILPDLVIKIDAVLASRASSAVDTAISCRTDPASRAWVRVSSLSRSADELRRLHIRGEDWGVAEVRLPHPFPGGNVDLGVVMLEGSAILAAGRVVDGAGIGVGDATVQVVESGFPEGAWPPRLAATKTDVNGAFKMRGAKPKVPYVLNAFHERLILVPATVPFTLGAKDLVLTMTVGASLHGSVLVDPEYAGLIEIDLREGKAAGNTRFAPRTTKLVRDEQWDFYAVRPGKVSVDVMARSLSEHPIAGQSPKPGERESVTVPRIDLRGLIVKSRVRVTDQEGTPLDAEVTITRYGSRGAVTVEATHPEPGVTEYLALRGNRYSVSVRRPGFHDELLQAAAGDVQVSLRTGISVCLRLRGAAMPAEPHALIATFDGVEARFDAKGEAWCAARPGMGKLSMRLEHRRADGVKVVVSIERLRRTEFNVPRNAKTASFDVEVDPAELQAALAGKGP